MASEQLYILVSKKFDRNARFCSSDDSQNVAAQPKRKNGFYSRPAQPVNKFVRCLRGWKIEPVGGL
jgi:hypothetical protein